MRPYILQSTYNWLENSSAILGTFAREDCGKRTGLLNLVLNLDHFAWNLESNSIYFIGLLHIYLKKWVLQSILHGTMVASCMVVDLNLVSDKAILVSAGYFLELCIQYS